MLNALSVKSDYSCESAWIFFILTQKYLLNGSTFLQYILY